MTNKELLLAMSDMMDTKLRAELRPLRNEMQDMKNELRNEMQSEIQSLRGEMQSEIQSLRSEMQGEIRGVKGEIQGIKGEIQGIKGEIQGVKGETQSLRSEIHQIKLFQENVILPRLETIESCYLDTYRRYRDNADKMEAVFEDVDMMKKVLADHSRQLQKLA